MSGTPSDSLLAHPRSAAQTISLLWKATKYSAGLATGPTALITMLSWYAAGVYAEHYSSTCERQPNSRQASNCGFYSSDITKNAAIISSAISSGVVFTSSMLYALLNTEGLDAYRNSGFSDGFKDGTRCLGACLRHGN